MEIEAVFPQEQTQDKVCVETQSLSKKGSMTLSDDCTEFSVEQ